MKIIDRFLGAGPQGRTGTSAPAISDEDARIESLLDSILGRRENPNERFDRFVVLARKLAAGAELSKSDQASLERLINEGVCTRDTLREAVAAIRGFEERLRTSVELVIKANAAKVAAAAAVKRIPELEAQLAAQKQICRDLQYSAIFAAGAVSALVDYAGKHESIFPDCHEIRAMVDRHVQRETGALPPASPG